MKNKKEINFLIKKENPTEYECLECLEYLKGRPFRKEFSIRAFNLFPHNENIVIYFLENILSPSYKNELGLISQAIPLIFIYNVSFRVKEKAIKIIYDDYWFNRIQLSEEEYLKILKIINENKKYFNWDFSLKLINKFPKNNEFIDYFIINILKNTFDNFYNHQSLAISFGLKEKSSKVAKMALLDFSLRKGNFIDAKILKKQLNEPFTENELNRVFKNLMNQSSFDGIKAFFDEIEGFEIKFVKLFVNKFDNIFKSQP